MDSLLAPSTHRCLQTQATYAVSGIFPTNTGVKRDYSSDSSPESIQECSPIDASALRAQMMFRDLPAIHDYATPNPSYLLSLSLSDFIPSILTPSPDSSAFEISESVIPASYHLVHFPPPTPISSLLLDGTDPLHSPGPPFTRRMWAGGSMTFHAPIYMKRWQVLCRERISDVTVKGKPGQEKIFVNISREISYRTKPAVEEIRTLVFMRDRLPPSDPETVLDQTKILKPSHPPDYTQALVPSASLLFRFSALTFNAHRIHLDKEYCRATEGHRNLLVHGPLSLILMLDCLRNELKIKSRNEIIKRVEYRNLAPVYAEEEMKVCGRQKGEDGSWEVWIEGKDGGMKVRGTVTTGPGEAAGLARKKRRERARLAKYTPESQAVTKEDSVTSQEA